ncbi:MAG: PfkB family carbohydrate kinase [Methylococcaceae bacterium]
MIEIDVLCVGHASYDLVFSVEEHPSEDEKIVANSLLSSGGGPAANAAVMIQKLGFKAAFAGYLGNDLYGNKHQQELAENKVDTSLIVRGELPTPLSAILVKPDGRRALINYKGDTQALSTQSIDFSRVNTKVILFDGHEPYISVPLAKDAKSKGIVTVLDAGSLHQGTKMLMELVDYVACSEKFAVQLAGDVRSALTQLANISPAVIITLGEKGLVWQRGKQRGELAAPQVSVVDTTGAGDAFHGALAVAIADGMCWEDCLIFASAAGSLCCMKLGARPGLPDENDLRSLFSQLADSRA